MLQDVWNNRIGLKYIVRNLWHRSFKILLNCMLNGSAGCIHLPHFSPEFRAWLAPDDYYHINLILDGVGSVVCILRLQEAKGARPTLAQTAFYFKCADEIDPPWGLDIFIDGANRNTWKPQCIEEPTEAVIHGSHAISNVLLLAQQIDFPVYAQDQFRLAPAVYFRLAAHFGFRVALKWLVLVLLTTPELGCNGHAGNFANIIISRIWEWQGALNDVSRSHI